MIDQDPIPTGPARDVRMLQRTGGSGQGGGTPAKVDTAAQRLQRLGAILGAGDVEALIEWHRSQSEQLGMPEPRLPAKVTQIV